MRTKVSTKSKPSKPTTTTSIPQSPLQSPVGGYGRTAQMLTAHLFAWAEVRRAMTPEWVAYMDEVMAANCAMFTDNDVVVN